MKHKQQRRKSTDKTRVVCARCGWRGKRSRATVWPACPHCNAPAGLIVPIPSLDEKPSASAAKRAH
jgi:hypothetical protein